MTSNTEYRAPAAAAGGELRSQEADLMVHGRGGRWAAAEGLARIQTRKTNSFLLAPGGAIAHQPAAGVG